MFFENSLSTPRIQGIHGNFWGPFTVFSLLLYFLFFFFFIFFS